MSAEKSVRCIQCGWTIASARIETVIWADGSTAALHKGGCPRPNDPQTHQQEVGSTE